MQITKNTLSSTKVELLVAADDKLLQQVKTATLKDLAKNLKLAGFRKGHAPLPLVEKSVDDGTVQKQFIDSAVNHMYAKAVHDSGVKPAAQPDVELTKFVPYSQLEIKITVENVGDIKLPDYKKFSFKKKVEPATDKDVETILTDLQRRQAEKSPVERAIKDGDEAVIDFSASDAKTKKPISGATGTDYALLVGSKSFIPGFEDELVGLKPTDTKEFTVTFPKDYSVTSLQNKRALFSVTIKTVNEVTLPKLDDDFAARFGDFKKLDDLKADIKNQVQAERENEAQQKLENDLLTQLAEQTKVDIPASLIEQDTERLVAEQKQNVLYRGQTWQEFLDANGQTEETYRKSLHDQAKQRVKAGLALGEMSQAEAITVTDADLQAQIDALKQRYTDEKMQAELDKPENRREVLTRMITEKTIEKLISYATAGKE